MCVFHLNLLQITCNEDDFEFHIEVIFIQTHCKVKTDYGKTLTDTLPNRVPVTNKGYERVSRVLARMDLIGSCL